MLNRKRKNEAVTTDGAPYNKRTRPTHDVLSNAEKYAAPGYDEKPDRGGSVQYDDAGLLENNAPMEEQEDGLGPSDHGSDDPSGAQILEPGLQATANSGTKCARPRHDPTYGQRGAFPGLDDDEPLEGEDAEALAYLRMVRSEARSIPHLLIAPKVEAAEGELDASLYNNSYGDSRGYYSDGAYVAATTLSPDIPHSTFSQKSPNNTADGIPIRPYTTPQSAYHTRLRTLFYSHRATLRTPPSATAIAALSPAQLISCPPHNRAANAEWRHTMQTLDPLPVQLASMDTETVLRLLRLASTALKRGEHLDKRLSCWIWGLLGRLPDVGTMGSEEVSVVRDLGKRAVWVRGGFSDRGLPKWMEGFGAQEEEDEEAHPVNADIEGTAAGLVLSTARHQPFDTIPQSVALDVGDLPRAANPAVMPEVLSNTLEAAKARLLARYSEESDPLAVPRVSFAGALSNGVVTPRTEPDENTCATLDMIITVVGEQYGQRDLLRYRGEWDDG